MDDNFKIAIGELVTKLRIERGIVSQNMLAQMADVSQSTVRELELGERTPTVETLAKICDVLKITLAEFFVEATGGMENKLLIDGLSPSNQESIKAIANTMKNMQNLPPETQKESNGLTNTENGGKIRYKRESKKKKDA
jgi:transcriptional regulator with XRE-family HTH domain